MNENKKKSFFRFLWLNKIILFQASNTPISLVVIYCFHIDRKIKLLNMEPFTNLNTVERIEYIALETRKILVRGLTIGIMIFLISWVLKFLVLWKRKKGENIYTSWRKFKSENSFNDLTL